MIAVLVEKLFPYWSIMVHDSLSCSSVLWIKVIILIFGFHPLSHMISSVNTFLFHDDIYANLSLNISNMPLMCYLVESRLFKRGGVRSAQILVEGDGIVKQSLQTAEEGKSNHSSLLIKKETILSTSVQHSSHFQINWLCILTISLKRHKSPKHSPNIFWRKGID